MNTFYSANGNFNKINLIEKFDEDHPSSMSIISFMIDNENMKNRINILENEIGRLEREIKLSQAQYLPFNNNKTSKIISKNSNNWMSVNGNIVIEIIYEENLDFVPQVYVEIVDNILSDIKYNVQVYEIGKNSFKCKLITDNIEYNKYIDNDGNSYSDILAFVRNRLSLNYVIIE